MSRAGARPARCHLQARGSGGRHGLVEELEEDLPTLGVGRVLTVEPGVLEGDGRSSVLRDEGQGHRRLQVMRALGDPGEGES